MQPKMDAIGTPSRSRQRDALVAAQRSWCARPVSERLQIMRRSRHLIAENASQLADAIDLPQRRGVAESVAAEVFPLADAIRFLERNAAGLLKPRKESSRDRPAWGRGLQVTTCREPLGVILVIATWNYPLFLTGVQMIQALVAGNAVVVKPAIGCTKVTQLLVDLLTAAGLPKGVVSIRTEDVEAARQAMSEGVDKVVFTGSASTGRLVMSQLADTGTPSVMELSGSDAVFLLPSADLARVAKCLSFGTQINGGATCIAPRRVFATQAILDRLKDHWIAEMRSIAAVPVFGPAGKTAVELIRSAQQSGAKLLVPEAFPDWTVGDRFPVTVLEVKDPLSPILHSDLFVPVVCLIPVENLEDALREDSNCLYALGASVFGSSAAAAEFAQRIDAGCVVVNDLVAPTADPRVAFGGRRNSGFGSTRGAQGLLEMTSVKSVVKQSSNWLPHLDEPIPELGPMLIDLLGLVHGCGLKSKMSAMRRLLDSGKAFWQASKKN